jgi:hypothetical protein
MANSITPSGTSRNAFELSLTDIISAGSITARLFKGIGKDLTNINATNITTGLLEISYGGTGNNTYINNGLIYKSGTGTRLINDSDLTWDPAEKKLKISNRDFIEDTSNYVKNTSNKLIDILNTTSNIIKQDISLNTNNVSNYILFTSNILAKNINANRNVNNIASRENLGSVIIGGGLHINTRGVISTTEEVIIKNTPTIVNSQLLFEPIEGVNYKVCKFLYNPLLGTTFDRTNGDNKLAIWYISSSNYLINDNNGKKIRNNGYFQPDTTTTKLNLFGNVSIKPENIEKLNIEYTPQNTTYLEFNSPDNTTNAYCKFETNFSLNDIYIKPGNNHSITISMWFKINNNNEKITIFEFRTQLDISIPHQFIMTYLNDTLTIYFDESTNIVTKISLISSIPGIYTKRWHHIILTIERITTGTNIKINFLINGKEKYEFIGRNDMFFYNGFLNYTENSISKLNNSNYNLCISDFKIYNYLLSEQEKEELYNTNKYTKYNIDFQDTDTICDILAFGGGGGGSSNYGGGAGKLVYINDAYISKGLKTIKIGRGGSGYNSNINNIQTSFNGNNTTFGIGDNDELKADGGGSITYPINNDNTYYNIPINNVGGCGSGNNGAITNFDITNNLYNFLGYTSNIYYRGYVGGPHGGGGIGKQGVGNNAGEALYDIDDISNMNIDSYKYFNYHNKINFKNDFNLIDSSIGQLSIDPVYNTLQVYIGCGGYGSNNIGAEPNIGYNSSNSGSGGNYGENGKNGALLIRVLTKIDRNELPSYVANTYNYINTTSNNIIKYINTRSDPSSTIWKINNTDIYFGNNLVGNVGIGMQTTGDFKLEVSSSYGRVAGYFGPFGIHTNQSNAIIVDTTLSSIFNANICAKFNSSIWATGNIIASSDERIKKDINDISDDRALQMILNIQPKTYNYIDWVNKGSNNIYGFIAQQIKDIIPDAVKIEREFIPNIFLTAVYNTIGNIIILPNNSINVENIINKYSKVKCYDMSNNIIIVEVIKIINEYSFKIKDINYLNNSIFVYGTEVNDFHVLNKEYINTLNVCAVQELHRKIVLQQNEINSLNERVNNLIQFIDLSK